MALTDMGAMLRHADESGFAIGAFTVTDLSVLAGVLEAAERCTAPVILSIAESQAEGSDLDTLLPAVEVAARRASVPVAIQFVGVSSLEWAIRAIRLGCNGLAVAAPQGVSDRRLTRQVVEMAHGCGVPVTGAATADTAKGFIDETGVDFLLLAGGADERPQAEDGRLIALATCESGAALAAGFARVDCGAALADAAADAVGAALEAGIGYAGLHSRVARAVAEATESRIRQWGGAGRAPELLAHCPAWESVEHLITYNVEPDAGQRVDAMLAEGREVLAALPGVRSVETGEAVDIGKARYRYCWLIRFAHSAVIDSYRDHPRHVAFADAWFRPVAPDRMSIDYRVSGGCRQSDGKRSK